MNSIPMKLLHVVPALFLLSLMGNQAFAQSEYFPLSTGQVSYLRYSDDFNNGDASLQMKMKVLEETKTIDGKEYFVLENSYGSGYDLSVISTSYMREAGDGKVVGMWEENPEEQVFLQKPYRVGNSWDIINMGVASTSTIVDVSGAIAGFSGCLVLEVDSDGTVVRSYFKEDVGLVAMSMMIEGKETLMVYRED